jgi:YD repeat-containing protein
VTNALGHVTTYDNYDANGRLLQMTDPNGVKTAYTYDARGRVQTLTETPVSGTARMTRYTYTATGQVETATDSDGVVLRYQYDAAQQLRHVIDALGNDHAYAYDTRGNQNADSLYDASGTLNRNEGREFDARNHLYHVNRAGVVTTSVHDALGVLRSLTDGNTYTTSYSPDALNRIVTVTDALSMNTVTGYDVNDRVVSVKAPNDLTTQYTVDDLGNVLAEVSPDRGTITYTTDAAGNVLTRRTDNGTTTSYRYDALNRLVSQQSTEATTPRYDYNYDTCGKKGVLCNIQQNGYFHLMYFYDNFGRRNYEASAAFLYTSYTYSPAGRLTSITYNDGRTVNYRYDAAGQVNEVDTTAAGTTTVLARNITYYPFGPVKSLGYGNGQGANQILDNAYRSQTRFDGGHFFESLYYDGADNILTRYVPGIQSYGYDAVNRLTSATDTTSFGTLGWHYDSNGNRQSETRGSTTTPYTYPGNTNWLYKIGDNDYRIPGTGGTTAFGTPFGFVGYDGYERAISMAGTVSYGYDALNRRLTKSVNAVTTRFNYGINGELLFETDGTNNKVYVYLNGIPLARIDNGNNFYYYHTDHLGTPQVMSDSTGTVVWAATYEPFGKATVTTQTIVNNLRFPGQYYDAESGLHYNWNRYYDPKTGRYE